jgi:hypothetical protein
MKNADFAEILHAEFASKGFQIPTTIAAGMDEKDAPVSNKKAREFFGIDFISGKDAVIAMANCLIEQGVVKPKIKSDKPIVLITGVSGFIGSYVCLDFLKSGEFQVRGTVRDVNGEKVAPLRKAFGDLYN